MLLVSAEVGPFKSINKPQAVGLDPAVTVLVGMNESGKTVFLQSLQKTRDAVGLAAFDPVDDYPRKDLSTYLKQHKAKVSDAAKLTYRLTEEEIAELNARFLTALAKDFEFSVTHRYDNRANVHLVVDEPQVVAALIAQADVSSDAKAALASVTSLRAIPAALKGSSLTDTDKTWLKEVEARIEAAPENWSVLKWEVWKWLEDRRPRFAFFGEYELLPSKMNLADLAAKVEQVKASKKQHPGQPAPPPKVLGSEQRGVLALLRMADIAVEDFTKSGGYEPLKARLESVSIRLTDQILEFWKQNEDLEVEIDIKPDPDDDPPFNNGPNLYLRIKNRRHRGASTPFHQRSRGFTWFFSFLVWFDEVQHQLEASDSGDTDLILLLDEPGLNLHALAQADFLRYIDDLATRHQVLYSTHSPFMVHTDRLRQVRVVEDRVKEGTVITESVTGSDPRTIFPLQAALGWTIAQNLFVSERNLLVEGPSDLLYIKAVSTLLEAAGRTRLREDITIVPTGGLDKVVTFVALLGANGLKLVVLHDYRGKPEQKLEALVRERLLHPKALLDASQFRDAANLGKSGRPSDVEDLFQVATYIQYFNKAFAKQLAGRVVAEGDLPPGDRVIERLERYLASSGLSLRPSGGFNHYAVAVEFSAKPPAPLDAESLDRFEALFKTVNALL